MEALPGLFLGLSTGALGDEGEPIDLVDEDGGAGPSSSGGAVEVHHGLAFCA